MGKEKGLITKGRFELKYRGEACRNCGQPLDLTDKYCPNCSQANSTKKLVLKDFFDEFLSSLINWDSKLLKTLYTMMVKPGTITKDYINGKRISYTNPFRFLFSLAFLYFLMFSYSSNFGKWNELGLDEKIKNEGNFNFSFDEDDHTDSTKTKNLNVIPLAKLDSIANNNNELPKDIKALDTLTTLINEGIREQQLADSLLKADPNKYYQNIETDDAGWFKRSEFFFRLLQRDSISNFEQAQQKFGVKKSMTNVFSFNAANSFLRALAQPGSWINDTIAKLPFVVFLFLPVFTIFIFVAYIRKNFTYTDHLIFSFHNQSLLFILLIISWIVDIIFDVSTAGLALLLFATYLFQAMRKFYGQNIFKTIIKYLFLNTVFSILALFAIILLSVGSVFTY